MSKKSFNLDKVCKCLIAILLGILVINVFLSYNVVKQVKSPTQKVPEQIKTEEMHNIEVLAITPSDCKECFDVNQVLPQLKQLPNVNLTKQEIIKESNAREQIKKYKLTKLPVIILMGDFEKLPLPPETKKVEGAIVLDNLPPPFYDLETKTVKGKLKITLILANACKECQDITKFSQQLKNMGVFLEDEKLFDETTKEARDLVKKYGIEKVPTVIMSREIEDYEQLALALKQSATKETDGSYVIRKVSAPFYDLQSKQVKGKVDVVMLVDSSCKECFDVKKLKESLKNLMGLAIKSEKTIEAKEKNGVELVGKYGISKIPALLISPELKEYAASEQWGDIGEVSKDGWYVVKNYDIVGQIVEGSIKDLKTGNTSVLVGS